MFAICGLLHRFCTAYGFSSGRVGYRHSGTGLNARRTAMFAKRSQGQLNASHWPRFGLALIALPLACLAIWVPGVASADLVNVAPSAGSTPAAPPQQTSIPSAPAPAPTPAAVATATPQAAPTTPA